MSSTIAKIIVAALAFGGAQALPNPSYASLSVLPITTTATAPPSTSSTPATNDDLIAKLKKAPTAIKKFQTLLTRTGELLPYDELKKLVVFDFNGATPNTGAKGGATKSANIDKFPILTDLGISTTMGFLGPCGMNTPHVHPRATEFLTVVEGEVKFGMILENDLTGPGKPSEITGDLKQFMGTVFPMGSIHYQVNPTCYNSTFVATLNSEDPGTSQIAQNFFGLDAEVVKATLGFGETVAGQDIESFRPYIPKNIALGIDECLQRCKLPKH